MLDAEEYLHLAINATQSGQHHAALEYLHKSLEQEPANAKAQFLLAAEHAELGLYDRAIDGMKAVLALAPEMEMARYQLVLLYMQQSLLEEATSIWEFFSESAVDEAIKLLARGLLIMDEDYETGMALIDEAVATGTSNAFLHQSITRIRDNLAESKAVSATESPVETGHLHSLLFNAYNDSKFTKDDN